MPESRVLTSYEVEAIEDALILSTITDERQAIRLLLATLRAAWTERDQVKVDARAMAADFQLIDSYKTLRAERDHWREQAQQKDAVIRIDSDIIERLGAQLDTARRWAHAWRRCAHNRKVWHREGKSA